MNRKSAIGLVSSVLILSIFVSFFQGNALANDIVSKKYNANALYKEINKLEKDKKMDVITNDNVKDYIISIPLKDIQKFNALNIKSKSTKVIVSEKENILYVHFDNVMIGDMNYRKNLKETLREYIVYNALLKNKELLNNELLKYDISLNESNTKNAYLSFNEKTNAKKGNTNIDDTVNQLIDKEFKKYIQLSETNKDANLYFNFLLTQSDRLGKIEYKINYSDFKNSVIFRDKSDFDKYLKLSSYRTRDNFKHDFAYRKHNINQMYNSIDNNLKVLHPGDEISFHSLFGKNDDGKKFKNGKALVGGKEVDVYGGGVCGAATGLFQGSLFNKDLELKTRGHSSWHDFLYLANINGEKIKVPGLDSTYYDKGLDLKIKNKGNFPIVLINRTKNNVEENFTITLKDNQRISELKFLNQNGKCYTWKRGNETIKNCYREVKK